MGSKAQDAGDVSSVERIENAIDTVIGYVDSTLKLPFSITYDVIEGEGEGIAARHSAGKAAEREFTDGSRLVALPMSFYVRMLSAKDARRNALSIAHTLDGAELLSKYGDSIDVEDVTLPQFIGVDAKGLATYEVAVKINYYSGDTAEESDL